MPPTHQGLVRIQQILILRILQALELQLGFLPRRHCRVAGNRDRLPQAQDIHQKQQNRHQQEQAVVHSRHHKIRFQKQHNNAAHRWDEHRQHPIPPGKRETERLACDKHHGRGNEQPRGKRIDHEECRLFRKISIRVDCRKKHQKRAAVYEVD